MSRSTHPSQTKGANMNGSKRTSSILSVRGTRDNVTDGAFCRMIGTCLTVQPLWKSTVFACQSRKQDGIAPVGITWPPHKYQHTEELPSNVALTFTVVPPPLLDCCSCSCSCMCGTCLRGGPAACLRAAVFPSARLWRHHPVTNVCA